jgi:two-component system cell cycle sensor histidine kinase/response regulator CckA
VTQTDAVLTTELQAEGCARRRHLEKMEAITRLASGLSCELSPLLRDAGNTVSALAGNPLLESAMQSRLEEVRESLQRGAVLVRQLEAVGRAVPRPAAEVELDDVVARLRPLFPRLAGPHITISEQIGARRERVVAEHGQVEQVLLTLVVNARDAMPLGGAMTIATHRWTLDTPKPHRHGMLPAGEWLVVEVSDTGIGMDDATLTQLFEPFFTTKELGFGSGLSLSAMYGMMAQRGGQVIVASEPGAGTTVSVCFPAQAAVAGQARDDDAKTAVLVVDDDEWVRNVTARVLRRAGYGVLEAEHGESALELLRDVAGQCVGTLLTDIHMPRLDGRRLAEVVRREHPGLHVVLMTGDAEGSDGIQAVLRKPFTAGELLAAVQPPRSV